MKYFFTLATTFFILPASAQAAVTDFKSLVSVLIGVLNTALMSIMGLIFLYVAWTLVDAWVIHGDEPKAQEKGKNTAIAGVIALVVIVSLWGVVGLVSSVLGR